MTDILTYKIVKTRKPHKCWGCTEQFEKGVKLRYQVSVDNGEFDRAYFCKVCEVTIRESYEELIDCGIGFGDVKDYFGWDENLQAVERTFE